MSNPPPKSSFRDVLTAEEKKTYDRMESVPEQIGKPQQAKVLITALMRSVAPYTNVQKKILLQITPLGDVERKGAVSNVKIAGSEIKFTIPENMFETAFIEAIDNHVPAKRLIKRDLGQFGEPSSRTPVFDEFADNDYAPDLKDNHIYLYDLSGDGVVDFTLKDKSALEAYFEGVPRSELLSIGLINEISALMRYESQSERRSSGDEKVGKGSAALERLAQEQNDAVLYQKITDSRMAAAEYLHVPSPSEIQNIRQMSGLADEARDFLQNAGTDVGEFSVLLEHMESIGNAAKELDRQLKYEKSQENRRGGGRDGGAARG